LSEALVDPRVYPGLHGLQADADGDGVDHLRRLKEEPVYGAPAWPAPKGVGGVVSATPAAGLNERRKSPRIRCAGSAEVRINGGEARTWGNLSDISLHGCYLEMYNTFPVSTKVDLVLKSCDFQIHSAGRVRASYPGLGMGIRFEEIDSGQQVQLKQLIALLTGHRAPALGGPGPENHVKEAYLMKEALQSTDPRALVDEIMEFFQKDSLLSRDKFHEIAGRVRRP
jgi:hypothetical protein